MQHSTRLTSSRRFSEIHQYGRGTANDLLVVRVLPNELDYSRIGFVVGRRVGGAVVRNRVKRRLREAVRTTPPIPGWDVVVIARRGADLASFWQLQRSVTSLLRRLGLIEENISAKGSPELKAADR
ncbi:MAG: ribonuclease P protein component [SAR202 cluster bacterium]|nr:ribonuclease P protein component [SAR202 cluster bacterium]